MLRLASSCRNFYIRTSVWWKYMVLITTELVGCRIWLRFWLFFHLGRTEYHISFGEISTAEYGWIQAQSTYCRFDCYFVGQTRKRLWSWTSEILTPSIFQKDFSIRDMLALSLVPHIYIKTQVISIRACFMRLDHSIFIFSIQGNILV